MTHINQITTQFKNKTLTKGQWTHHAHIAVAFHQLSADNDLETAITILRKDIQAFNLSVGVENTDSSGYHETLTIFWLTVINEFLLVNNDLEIDDAYDRFIASSFSSVQLPLQFYSSELLFSFAARRGWMEPDLLSMSQVGIVMKKI